MAARHFAAALLLVTLSTAVTAPTIAPGQTAPPGSASNPQISLLDTLNKGLKVRRPSEFSFNAGVVLLVNQGVLPESLVRSTFLWARRKSLKNPFPYFQQALLLQAAKIGVRM